MPIGVCIKNPEDLSYAWTYQVVGSCPHPEAQGIDLRERNGDFETYVRGETALLHVGSQTWFRLTGLACSGGNQNYKLVDVQIWAIATMCPVSPLPTVTDPESLPFEANGDLIDFASTTEALQTAATCMEQAVVENNGAIQFQSAYRPEIYQKHLTDLWNASRDIRRLPPNKYPECAARRTQIKNEMNKHALMYEPSRNSEHPLGNAFDARVTLPEPTPPATSPTMDSLAAKCKLERPLKVNDKNHYHLLPSQ